MSYPLNCLFVLLLASNSLLIGREIAKKWNVPVIEFTYHCYLPPWYHFTSVMEHFLPWCHFTPVMWHFLPWYNLTSVMEHFLPWYHFTPVMWHFLPWYNVTSVMEHFPFLDIILLPWCDIFYLDIMWLPWWNIFYLDIILLPWCDVFYLDIIWWKNTGDHMLVSDPVK